jgi:IS5 family transposase
MKTQQTFGDIEYSQRKRVSRREIFLKKMDALIPWSQLVTVIQPYYYSGKCSRPPREIELMLRMYLLQLVRKEDGFANGDAGYTGIEKREEIKSDEDLSRIQWRINRSKGKARALETQLYKEAAKHLEYVVQPRWDEREEYLKSKVRSKIEHNFYLIKHLFGYRKTRYRGLAKNGARLYILFALANILHWSLRLDSLGALAAAV